MAVQEASPFTALSLVPDIDDPDADITCLESWGECGRGAT